MAVDYDAFDAVIVDRIVAGDPAGAPITTAAAAEAVRRLARAGYDDGQIAYRLNYRRRSVLRIRHRRGIPGALKVGQNDHHRLHNAPSRPRDRG